MQKPKKISQLKQKIEQNADSDSKINILYSVEPSGSLWVPHLKKNYIIRENPGNLLGNPGARLPFHFLAILREARVPPGFPI